ncbi:hypothetical protein AAG906_025698 [Vitis piasezkii]|uniref:Uncharacterized protein n=1 Tax=Vitis vinifera TaxID=29760 RepID=A0A438HKK7_VITVI|nr:hypothetical protein CK203_110502 [Vitis vinifera]RVW84998.1 hypothetical protein CK203_037620 [Vitis vinifera]
MSSNSSRQTPGQCDFMTIIYCFVEEVFWMTSRPEYNQILVKKPGGPDWWPY